MFKIGDKVIYNGLRHHIRDRRQRRRSPGPEAGGAGQDTPENRLKVEGDFCYLVNGRTAWIPEYEIRAYQKICPVCQKAVSLDAKNRISKHRHKTKMEVCYGSLMPDQEF